MMSVTYVPVALLNKSNFCWVEGAEHASSGNMSRSMAKQKFRITNWRSHNKALILRGTITFWRDGEAIQAWYESATPSLRGRPQRYSDLAITTALVIKRVFRLTDPAGLNCPRKLDSYLLDG